MSIYVCVYMYYALSQEWQKVSISISTLYFFLANDPSFWLGKLQSRAKPSFTIPLVFMHIMGFPGCSVLRNPPANAGATGDTSLIPWFGKILWRRKWQPTPAFLPGKSHGQRSLSKG